MKVYMKNIYQQQTVRDIPLMKALWLRWKVFIDYRKKERPTIRFLL